MEYFVNVKRFIFITVKKRELRVFQGFYSLVGKPLPKQGTKV